MDAESAADGELVDFIVGVGQRHHAFLKDGYDGGVMLEHGERPL